MTEKEKSKVVVEFVEDEVDLLQPGTSLKSPSRGTPPPSPPSTLTIDAERHKKKRNRVDFEFYRSRFSNTYEDVALYFADSMGLCSDSRETMDDQLEAELM